jgi:hypothetical protein
LPSAPADGYIDDVLLSTKGVADMMHISVERVRQIVAAGDLPAQISPLGRLFLKSDVEFLIARRERHNRERYPFGTKKEQRFQRQAWKLMQRDYR